ncbi:MAG: hypothetical protein JXA42_11515 [Anaerolineales bacterium]|nr:hypothetical protein [Anaerolineales bacterium]
MRDRSFLKHSIIVIILMVILGVPILILGRYFKALSYIESNAYHPTSQEIFSRYLAHPGNNELFERAVNILAEEWAMGQGVYIRFMADKKQVIEFLDRDSENPSYNHYPYASVECDEFFDAYAERADKMIEWWRPGDITSPGCLVTRECEYFLFDTYNDQVYYFYFPDFLGRDFYCVNLQGERGEGQR